MQSRRTTMLVLLGLVALAAIGIGLASKAGIIDLGWPVALVIVGVVIAASFGYEYAVRPRRKHDE